MSRDNYQTFCTQMEDVLRKFPSLLIKDRDNRKYLKGILDIPNEDSKIVGSYLIEIHFVNKFPFRFPILFETGASILNEGDWHKYSDGSCCITVLPDEILKCKHGITVLEFIEKYALSFFANHMYKRLTGNYLNREYSHGRLGLFQFYSDLLKTEDVNKWLGYFKSVFRNEGKNYQRNSKCFCGSDSKFKSCHSKIFDSLREIGYEQSLNDFNFICS